MRAWGSRLPGGIAGICIEKRDIIRRGSVTLQTPGRRRKHLLSVQRCSQFLKCATGLGRVLTPFQEISIQMEMCFPKSISEMS